MTESNNPALVRILASRPNQAVFDFLTRGISGADLTTLLLGVFAARADDVRSADLVRQYQTDRFVSPAAVDALPLARLELQALEVAASSFEPVALAPVAPLGTHLAMGGVPQNNVVSTARLSEVTADPTNSLALEAAARRSAILGRDARSGQPVHLAAVHRVARAQRFEGPRSFAHFSLLGLVSASRDRGHHHFEEVAISSQLAVLVDIIRTVTLAPIVIRLTAFNDRVSSVCDSLVADFAIDGVTCELWPERTHGRGYYRNVCFSVTVDVGDDEYEVGDGGDVWWTQRLLQSRKERLVIGGLGLERLAMLGINYPGLVVSASDQGSEERHVDVDR